jgi:hypothetical protein
VRRALALDIAVKATLIASLLYAIVRQAACATRTTTRRGRSAQRWDTSARARRSGNALNLYDTISWWDEVNHFFNWGVLTAGFGQLLVRLPLERWVAFGLAVGFGAVTAILWELGEYVAFIRNSPELRTAYTDTLGDLGLGLSGSVVAAALTVTLLWPRADRAARPGPAPRDSPATG